MHKIKGGEAFHLITLLSPVYSIVNLFGIGLVSEGLILGKPCYGSLGTIIPIPVQGWRTREDRQRSHNVRKSEEIIVDNRLISVTTGNGSLEIVGNNNFRDLFQNTAWHSHTP